MARGQKFPSKTILFGTKIFHELLTVHSPASVLHRGAIDAISPLRTPPLRQGGYSTCFGRPPGREHGAYGVRSDDGGGPDQLSQMEHQLLHAKRQRHARTLAACENECFAASGASVLLMHGPYRGKQAAQQIFRRSIHVRRPPGRNGLPTASSLTRLKRVFRRVAASSRQGSFVCVSL
jgi:hypothetical protein